MERAKLIEQSTLNIHLSKKQVKANVQQLGGFLEMLAALASEALLTLPGGLATLLVSEIVEKAVGGRGRLHLHQSGRGDGVYLHKSGHCFKMEPTKGNALRLTPNRFVVHGDGQYLKRKSQIYNERGLLGRNIPFKNIPMLNLLL